MVKTKRVALSAGVVCLLAMLTRTGHAVTEVSLPRVEQAQRSLNGDWKITLDPPEAFWLNAVSPASWDSIPVPGELHANGFLIEYDRPFVYKKQVDIPADYAGQRILLHFNAVYSHARVWVNEREVAVHQGGFTPWDCDITGVVTPGEKAWVTIAVTSSSKEISFAGKALRNIGGILRDVELHARPTTFLDGLIISTAFDGEGHDARLTVKGDVNMPDADCEVFFSLFDPQGRKVEMPSACASLGRPGVHAEMDVKAPMKWNAEHPHLYSLLVELRNKDGTYASYRKRIGFRQISFDGKNNLLVNGKVVKLRGVNRHISDPERGRVPTPEYDLLDAQLIKEANMNFVRTSHYPPGVRFLEYCDEIGLYVMVESAVVDAGKENRPTSGMNIHDDPKFRPFYISQLEEMLSAYGSHPAAIIWSICNESVFGRNLKASYDFVKNTDPSRPVVASYQIVMDVRNQTYDIKSHHYPSWNRDFADVGMSTLYDEWMHVLGHGADEWFHDPNGRDYWGRSLDKAWANLFPADGSIGAAIWQYVDDVTYMPTPLGPCARGPRRLIRPERLRVATPDPDGNVFGVARWGLVDEWRRKKPEFWNTQKAYSPIRILDCTVMSFESGKPISLPVHNRFDHTDLNEIRMIVEYDGVEQSAMCNALAPHGKGALIVPGMKWREGSACVLKFYDIRQRMVDAYTIQLVRGTPPDAMSSDSPVPVSVVDTDEYIAVTAGESRYVFSKTSGLLERVITADETYGLRGPFIHMVQYAEYQKMEAGKRKRVIESLFEPEPGIWRCQRISGSLEGGGGVVMIKGSYDAMNVDYVFKIHGDGQCDVDYNFSNIPMLSTEGNLDNNGGAQMMEFGITFGIGDVFDELAWNRKAYWTWYPDGHMGALKGRVPIFSETKPVYRQKPDQPWELDVHDYFYQGVNVPTGRLMPNIVKSAKMGIYAYSLTDTDKDVALTVMADADVSCRLAQAPDKSYHLQILHTLDYVLRWGNYSAGYDVLPCRQGRVRLSFGVNK